MENNYGNGTPIAPLGDESSNPLLSDITSTTEAAANGGIVMPIDGLPTKVQQLINDVATAYEAHRDKATLSLFAGVAAVTGKKVTTDLKKHKNHPQLWGCIVDNQGTNKTDILKFFFAPIIDKDKEGKQYYNKALKEWKATHDKNAPLAGKPNAYHPYTSTINTPEKLLRLLIDSPHGITIYADELKMLFNNFGRYASNGKASEEQFYLSAWSNQYYSFDRVSEDEQLFCDDPVLSIIGGMQPLVMKETFKKYAESQDGFTNRWLFVAPPPSEPKPFKFSAIDVNNAARTWIEIVEQLTRIEPTTYTLDDEAKVLYEQADKDALNTWKDNHYMLQYWAKNAANVCRIATIIHLLNDYKRPTINASEVQSAVDCMKALNEYAAKCYRLITTKEQNQASAKAIIRMLFDYYQAKGKDINTINQSDIARILGVNQSLVSNIKRDTPTK